MQIKETIGVSFPGSVERPPLEDVVVLVDSPGVALGAQRASCARMRGVRDGGLIASRYVEIPLVESDGEVSGILCDACPPSDTEPRNVGIEPHYYSAVGNLQGARMILFPLIMTWMWFQIFQDITDSVFRIPPSSTPATLRYRGRTVAFEAG